MMAPEPDRYEETIPSTSNPLQSTPTSSHQHGQTMPSSSLLQDLLREKKAQSHRINKTRRRTSRGWEGNDGRNGVEDTAMVRQVQSSPIGGPHGANDTAASKAANVGAKLPAGIRGMGSRELDEYISNLNKKNFDLKLELYHRRQRTTALEKQLEQIPALESENSELQDINEQLLEELEKRDRAVQEAVGIICDLEEKVEVLEEAMDFHSPPSLHPGTEEQAVEVPIPRSNEDTPKTPVQKVSRPDLSHMPSARLIDFASPTKFKTPSRTPSFLTSDKGGSAGALRSLYLAGEGDSKLHFPTLTNRKSSLNRESFPLGSPEHADGLDSPRLSVLSEADFMSVYGDTTRLDLDANATPTKGMPLTDDHENRERDASNERRRKTRAERLQKWMDDRATPSKPSAAPSSVPHSASRFLSIGDALNIRTPVGEERNKPMTPPESLRQKKHKETKNSPLLGGPIFGGDEVSEGLGATDRTINNSSTSSIIAERSLLDGTPAAVRSYTALRPAERPRSAGDDITRSSRDAFRGYETDYESEESELEGRSLCVESGGYDDDSEHQIDIGQLPMFGKMSPTAVKMLEKATPSKSQLRERGYGGDMMFNGEGIDELASMRGRKRSNQPQNHGHRPQQSDYHRSALSAVEAITSSPFDQGQNVQREPLGYDGANSPAQELRHRPQHQPQRSMTPPPVPEHSRRAQHALDSKMPPSSFRFRVPRVSVTPSPPKRGSLKSRIFGGRSTTQNSPIEPLSPRDQASALSRPLRPLGALIRSNTTEQVPQASGVYVRPGTAGSVEARSYHDRQLRGQHSGSTRGESSGGEGVWTPGGNGRGDSFTSEDADYDRDQGRMEKSAAPVIRHRRADSQPRIRRETDTEVPLSGSRRPTFARTSHAPDH